MSFQETLVRFYKAGRLPVALTIELLFFFCIVVFTLDSMQMMTQVMKLAAPAAPEDKLILYILSALLFQMLLIIILFYDWWRRIARSAFSEICEAILEKRKTNRRGLDEDRDE